MTLLADSLTSELLIYPCYCLLLKIQVDSHQKRLSFWARTNPSSTLARAERRSEFYKISQSQSERDCLQVNWERDSLQWGWMSVLQEESLSAGWERNALPGTRRITSNVKTVSAPRETGSQGHRSWIQGTGGRPTWLPFRSWRGIEMKEQCAGRLDAPQERRDKHTKSCRQPKKWHSQMRFPSSLS